MKKPESSIRRFIEPELASSSDILLVTDASAKIVESVGEARHVPSDGEVDSVLDLLDGIVSARELLDDLRDLGSDRVVNRRLIPLKDEGVLLLSSLPLDGGGGRLWHLRDVTDVVRSQEIRGALLRIAEVSASARSLDELYWRLHEIIGSLMHAENFYIAIHDKENNLLRFPYFVDAVDPQPPALPIGRGMTAYLLRTGRPLLVRPEDFDALVESGEVERVGADCVDWVGVPLKFGDETIGMIGLQSYDPSIRYTREDLDLVVFVSQHIAGVIERRQNEEALRESEKRYRQMFDNNRAVKLVIDPLDGQIVDVNRAAVEFYGYTRENLRSMRVSDLNILPEDEIRSEMEKAASRQQSYFEFRHRIASGEIRDVEVYSGPFEVEGKTFLYSIISDVTEKRYAESLLRIQATAIESSMDGIAVIDSGGKIAYVNDSFKKLYGYPERDLVGRPWIHLHAEDEQERLERDVMARLDRSGQWAGSSIGLRRNALQFPEEMSLTRLEDGSFVCVVRDVTERTQAEEQIRHLAYHDPLTELPNRLLFRDRLNVALSHALRQDGHLAVLFLDLDRFKVINDSLGHNTGDALLQAVAERVLEVVRESDTVARLGGDEFTVLLPTLRSQEDAVSIARKILETIRAPFFIEGRELFVTTSIGVSIFPDDGEQADELIKNADTAMYQAKENGRNNIQSFNAVVNARTLERLALENGLRRGLAHSEFEIYYQPIIDLPSGGLHGCEALLRWNHPENGVIPPGNFIRLAEETGLMVPIGTWVLNEAASQLGRWHAEGFDDLKIAVNVSASQIQQADFIDHVWAAIDRAGIEPRFLEIEITESYAMEDPEVSAETLAQLKAVGVSISVDDFGTGYSSLSYLKRFPIDTLKIDASFVRDMNDDEDTAEIVSAIIAMGRNLRLRIVAEGVELEQHRDRLLENRCDRAQGFLYSPPLTADAFVAFLRDQQARAEPEEGIRKS